MSSLSSCPHSTLPERASREALRLITRGLLSTLLASGLALFSATAGHANLIFVDTFVDEFDANASGDAGCSLREAIHSANVGNGIAFGSCAGGAAGEDTIFLPAEIDSATGTYQLTLSSIPGFEENEGDLAILSPISILGTGGTPVIDASVLGDRLFHVGINAGSFEITNAKLVGGEASSGGTTFDRLDGGAIRTYNSVQLQLADVTIENCTARNGGAIELGAAGAQASEPIFDFQSVVFRNNTATSNGGALYLQPGNVSQIRCEGCTFDSNQTSGFGGTAGAILSFFKARLQLIDSILIDNESRFGGAIDSSGSWITLSNVEIGGNTHEFGPLGYTGTDSSVLIVHDSIVRDPIHIFDLTDMQATNSRFETSTQPVIDATGGLVTLTDSVVADNDCVDCEEFAIRAEATQVELHQTVVEGNDGGLDCYDCDLLLNRSSFVANTRRSAMGDGAALRVSGIAEVEIANSTFSGNVASLDTLGLEYGTGAGIYIDNGLSFVLNNVTIAENRGGGLHAGATVAPKLSNTLLAGNIDGTTFSTFGSDCTGTVASQGWNLIGLDTGCFASPTVGDQVGVLGSPISAQLDALTVVGGLPVHGLLPGSPARDAGNSTAPDGTAPRCKTSDQVGTSRPQDGGGGAVCDIGAIEGSVVGDDVVFGDGFESGDAQAWSSTTP